MEAHNEANPDLDATDNSSPLLNHPRGNTAAQSSVESRHESRHDSGLGEMFPGSNTHMGQVQGNPTELLPLQSSRDSGDMSQDSNQDNPDVQGPPQRSSHQRYRIFWYWKVEIAALVLSFGLVAAMYALLLSYDGEKVPDWKFPINLSTLLDLLAQLFTAAMGTIVAQIISQEKWTWFSVPENEARPLHDLQSFDQGSRDALGAALLIPKVFHRNITAAVAALVMIISLAVGPFVQQAVQTTPCSYTLPDTNASIPYAHYVPRQGVVFDDGNIELFGTSGLDLETAIYSSLISGSSAAENQINPDCSTGNCTFPAGDPVESSNGTFTIPNATEFGGFSGSFSTAAVCSRCVDVTSLVSLVEENEGSYVYGLPNGLNISYEAYGMFVKVATDSNLTWVGDLLSPELAQVSRWAMVNVTFLSFSVAQCGNTETPQCPIPGKTMLGGLDAAVPNKTAGGIAATCAIYPCIRGYVPSITNNKLSESQINSSNVWPVKTYEDEFYDLGIQNALTNELSHYAGIHSPCRVGDAIYTTQNMSTAPNTTTLQMYETVINTTVQSRNVSAPEQCIYRHNAAFVSALSEIFHEDTMFNTYCQNDPRIGPNCDNQGTDGMNKWLDTLYNNGNATVSAVEAYFESFASAMTNKFRSTFGTSQFILNDNAYQTLPLGEVQGLVWKDTVCTAAEWEWLFLPAGLLLLTSSLLAITMARSWRLRHSQPVWKSNVLPTLLYKERFRNSNDSSSTGAQAITDANITKRSPTDTDEHIGGLLEIDEMRRLTKKVMVRFERYDMEHKSTQDTESQRGWLRREKRAMDVQVSDVNSHLMN